MKRGPSRSVRAACDSEYREIFISCLWESAGFALVLSACMVAAVVGVLYLF